MKLSYGVILTVWGLLVLYVEILRRLVGFRWLRWLQGALLVAGALLMAHSLWQLLQNWH